MSAVCRIDNKYVPLYRVMWISELPHYCGDDECHCEGRYEVRLEMEEAVWANREERDQALAALEAWARGGETEEEWP